MEMISTREFTLINQTAGSARTIPWNDNSLAKLWLYHLNYFGFLNLRLHLPNDKALLRAALAIALDWCQHSTRGTEVGWEPYPLSVRIVNWLKFRVRHELEIEQLGEGAKKRRLIESLGVQVATLERRLEMDILGNHLMKNLKALLFAGAWLETPRSDDWWTKGALLLQEQLNEQILPDGGHFERSPMYHCQVLEDLAEIKLLCRSMQRILPCQDLLSDKIVSMARFLKGIVHPDGEIPLFNDSVLGGACAPECLTVMSGLPDVGAAQDARQVIVFPESGYATIRSPECRSTLIFDCGPLGPDYQPGHGHCDLLSYELSLKGQRVVVDTGVSTYQREPERIFERSTAAHNTLRIDGEEQAEIWGSFRVGRRPGMSKVCGGTEGPLSFVKGDHWAYRRLGVEHARKVLWQGPDTWVVVDRVTGRGTHVIEFFLHFHPHVRVAADAVVRDAGSDLPTRRWAVSFLDDTYWLLT